jgi:hypothetical protein
VVFHQTLGRISLGCAHLGSELVGSMGIRCKWHEDGVPWPNGVDAVEGLIVLGDDEHLVSAAGAADTDELVTKEGEVR